MNKLQFLLTFLFVFFCAYTESASANDDGLSCSAIDAVYKPHPSYPKKEFDLTLTVEKPYAYGWARDFKITAYDLNSHAKLSSYRASIFTPVSDYRAFDFIALMKDFSPSPDGVNGNAPYVIVLNNTKKVELDSTQADKDSKEPPNLSLTNPMDDLNDLIFYSDGNVLPDFRGIDVWILSTCDKQN